MTKTANAVRRMALPVIVAAFGVLPFSMAARADVIFDFSGTCAVDCSGTATGVVDLSNSYVFGSNITSADFVSLSYASSDFNFTIPAASNPFLAGGLNADGSTTGGLVIAGNSIFASTMGVFLAHNGGSSTDIGSSLTFSLVSDGTGSVSTDPSPAPDPTPLPAALPLFLSGLGALGLLGWRRKRNERASLLGAA
jgi:hypothetical protein